MKNKLFPLAISLLTVGSIISINLVTSHVYATEKIITQDVTPADPAPFEVQQKQEHPDAIVTKDGRYDKNNQTEQVFKTNEIVHDAQQTNESTKVIIQNGDTFIKLNNQ